MEDSLFGNESFSVKEDSGDMKNVLDDLFAETAEVKPVIHIPVAGSSKYLDEPVPVVPSKKETSSKQSRKRKAQTTIDHGENIVFKPPKTDPQVDHDYIAKSNVVSSSWESYSKGTTS